MRQHTLRHFTSYAFADMIRYCRQPPLFYYATPIRHCMLPLMRRAALTRRRRRYCRREPPMPFCCHAITICCFCQFSHASRFRLRPKAADTPPRLFIAASARCDALSAAVRENRCAMLLRWQPHAALMPQPPRQPLSMVRQLAFQLLPFRMATAAPKRRQRCYAAAADIRHCREAISLPLFADYQPPRR